MLGFWVPEIPIGFPWFAGSLFSSEKFLENPKKDSNFTISLLILRSEKKQRTTEFPKKIKICHVFQRISAEKINLDALLAMIEGIFQMKPIMFL
jgi:hypothetical protein